MLSIEQHTDQWKNHCANSKHVRNNLFVSVDLDISAHLEIGICLNGFASTRRKVRCRGRSYALASTRHSTEQRSRFNPVMLKYVVTWNKILDRLTTLVKTVVRTFGIIKMQFNFVFLM